MLMKPVRDIAGAPPGHYWDGGIIDYNLALPYARMAGNEPGAIVLYPHFSEHIVPGWLDKAMPWRRAARGPNRGWLDNVLIVAPSKFPMSLQCGIVGLPNVGKSTLFNALTKAGIPAENYPFCTIEPNVGVVEVPDPRMRGAGRDRQAGARGESHRRVRRHRRPGGRRVEGRGPGQPVPVAHPRNRRHRQRGALLRRRQRDPRVRQGQPDRRHRSHPDRTGAGRHGHRRESLHRENKKAPLRRQGRGQAGARSGKACCRT
jgi:hypothetical protein